MRIMVAVAFVLVLLVGVDGCAGLMQPAQTSSVGWNFSVGRPSTLITTSPTVLNQQSGPVGIQPMGSLTGTSPSIIHAPAPAMPMPTGTKFIPFTGPNIATSQCGDCSMETICNKLDKVIDALGAKRED